MTKSLFGTSGCPGKTDKQPLKPCFLDGEMWLYRHKSEPVPNNMNKMQPLYTTFHQVSTKTPDYFFPKYTNFRPVSGGTCIRNLLVLQAPVVRETKFNWENFISVPSFWGSKSEPKYSRKKNPVAIPIFRRET